MHSACRFCRPHLYFLLNEITNWRWGYHGINISLDFDSSFLNFSCCMPYFSIFYPLFSILKTPTHSLINHSTTYRTIYIVCLKIIVSIIILDFLGNQTLIAFKEGFYSNASFPNIISAINGTLVLEPFFKERAKICLKNS